MPAETNIPETPATDEGAQQFIEPMDILSDSAIKQIHEESKQEAAQTPAEPAAVSEPGAGGNEGGSAAQTPPAKAVKEATLEQRDDGKFQYGSFVGDSVEDVLGKVEKSRRELQSQITPELQRQAKAQELAFDADDDEDELISDEEWAEFERFKQLQASGGPQGGGPLDAIAALNARRVVERLVNDPYADQAQLEQAARAAVEINAPDLYQKAVNTWARIDMVGATNFERQVHTALQQAAYAEQQQQQTVQQQQHNEVAQRSHKALETAWNAFQTEAPDHQQLDSGIRQYLSERPWMIPAAQQAALANGDATPLLQVYRDAANYARAAGGAAQPVTTQQGVQVQVPAAPPTQEQLMQQQSQAMTQMKRDAQSGTSGASDVAVQTVGSAPDGQVQQDLEAFAKLFNGPKGLDALR